MVKHVEARVRGEGVAQTSKLEMDVKELSGFERLKKALVWAGVFVSLGLFSVLIPVVHFIAVPTFLLLALGALVLVPLAKTKILRAEADCPYCQRRTNLKRASVELPFRDSCEHCHQILHIEKVILS